MISLKLKMPVNTFQTLATCFAPIEFAPEKEDATPVEMTLQISEETAGDFLQSYKDLFPMMILSAPHLFAQQDSDSPEKRIVSPEEFMEMMKKNGEIAEDPDEPSDEIKDKAKKIEKIGYA